MTAISIDNLTRRLNKLGISVEYVSNTPWIYLHKINGKLVTEKFQGNHGFTVAWYPIKAGINITLSDTKEIFKLIRKYL